MAIGGKILLPPVVAVFIASKLQICEACTARSAFLATCRHHPKHRRVPAGVLGEIKLRGSLTSALFSSPGSSTPLSTLQPIDPKMPSPSAFCGINSSWVQRRRHVFLSDTRAADHSNKNNNTLASSVGSALQSCRQNFLFGVQTTNERFFDVLLRAIFRASVPLSFIAGVLPLLAYYTFSPQIGVAVSRSIVSAVVSFDRFFCARAIIALSFFTPILKLLESIYGVILLAIAITISFPILQYYIVKDVWKGEATVVTFFKDVIEQATEWAEKDSSEAAKTAPKNVNEVVDKYLNTGDPGVMIENLSFTMFLLVPIMEEITFRGIWLGGYDLLTRQWKKLWKRASKSKSEAKGIRSISAEEEEAKRTSPERDRLIFGHRPVVFLSCLTFAVLHLGNAIGSIRPLQAQTVVSGEEMKFIFIVLGNLASTFLPVSVSFLASLNIFAPLFQSNGLACSVGAHLMWNLRATFLVPLIYMKLIRTAFERLKEKDGRTRKLDTLK